MKWLVGMDLARSTRGALRFGQWLRQHVGDEVSGLHSLELPAAATEVWTEVVRGKIQKHLEAFEQENDASGLPFEVVESADPAATLLEAADRTGVDGIVIGRRSRADEIALVRLGRIARRSIRAAHLPLVVVPPELDLDERNGPVILATDGTSRTGADAARFARTVATAWNRPCVACHVASDVDAYAARYILDPAKLVEAREALKESGKRLLSGWRNGLPKASAPDETVLLQGFALGELLALVKERHASMLVVGARHLSKLDRLFVSSLGAELAAYADCPVAIVPPAASAEQAH